jgi:hypothetical protein
MRTADNLAEEAMTDPIQELRRLAEAATPGPWDAAYDDAVEGHYVAKRYESGWAGDVATHGPTAAYIAALSPDIVLALLDALAAAEQAASMAEQYEKLAAVEAARADAAEQRAEVAEAHVAELEATGSPGVMHAVDKAFYDLTVKQRDLAWRESDRLKAERDEVVVALREIEAMAKEDADFAEALADDQPYVNETTRGIERVARAALSHIEDSGRGDEAATQPTSRVGAPETPDSARPETLGGVPVDKKLYGPVEKHNR